MSYRAWVCETCKKSDTIVVPWKCLGCDIEICEHCFDSNGCCKSCCTSMSEAETQALYEKEFWVYND